MSAPYGATEYRYYFSGYKPLAASGVAAPSPTAELTGRQSLPPPPASPRLDWKIYATDHFTIYSTQELDSHFERIGLDAERAYRRSVRTCATTWLSRPLWFCS